ncbi:DUF1254 domain-containing protein [Vibrio maerlii]|uniref:DUF1254 domain-containing protein n=1 Tax=Vibrio maerlii TaxID=2231648 RepID=UPI000E3C472C|nr:DUF1254 domain-containing protein [Vibrio maerlii]
MKKSYLAASIALFSSLSVAGPQLEIDREIGREDGRSTEQVIASIDSSSWSVDPADYGLTAMEYQRGEADMFFSMVQARANGINQFFHFPALSKAKDHFVVSPNNDTMYSLAVVDASEGFTITIPDAGDRFISLHIHDYNHTFVDYDWAPGTYTFDKNEIDTDYVVIGVRIATDGSDSDQAVVRETLQTHLNIQSNSSNKFVSTHDKEDILKLREALLTEYTQLDNTYGAVKYDIRAVDDWEKWTVTVAGAWGLSPDDTAMYPAFTPANTKGNTCYEASFEAVPAKSFFSLTLYGPDNYLMSDDFNIVSSNRESFIQRADGGFDVVFGGKQCKSIADERGANFAYTPKDGWGGLLRSYQPDVDKMYNYTMPELKKISE